MKYRVLRDMVGWVKDEIVDIDPTVGEKLVKAGYFEPAPMEEAKQDKMIHRAPRHKEE